MMTTFFLSVLNGAMIGTNAFDPTDEIVLKLYKDPFTPSLDPTPLTEADFDGYPDGWGVGGMTIESAIGGYNPNTGLTEVLLQYPASGTALVVASNVSLPQTMYGWGLFNNNANKTLWTENFPNPVTLANVGDVMTLPATLNFNIDPSGVFVDPNQLNP